MADEIINFYKKAKEPDEPQKPIEEQKETPVPEIPKPDEPFDRFLLELAEKLQKEKVITEKQQETFVEQIKEPVSIDPNENDPFKKFIGSFANILKEDELVNREENIKEATISFINKLKEQPEEPFIIKDKPIVKIKKQKYLPTTIAKKVQKLPQPVKKEEPVVAEQTAEPVKEEPREENTYVKELKTTDKNNKKTPEKVKSVSDIKSIVEKQVAEILSRYPNLGFTGGGGGTNAVQYAEGGTMDGNLTVNGTVNATTYLSGGINLYNLLSSSGDGGEADRLISGSASLVLNPNGTIDFPDDTIRPQDETILTLESENPALSSYTRVALSPYAFFAYDNEGNSITFDEVDNAIVLTSQDEHEWTFNKQGVLVGPHGSLTVNALSSLGQILSGGVPLHNIFLTSETDAQSLSFNELTEFLSISNGNSVSLSSLSDKNYTNSNFLKLSGGTVSGNLTVQGNISALGTATFANTIFTTTSALSVVNTGPGPALYVFQSAGPYDVASFYDGDGIEVLHVGNAGLGGFGKVGINESFPNEELTVRGSISATETVYATTIVSPTLSSTNATLSTVVLTPIATLSSTNFITSRSLQDKLGEIISVKDFGARGNGVTNDWLSIQRALSAAAGIAKVYIPSGLYFINQELKIPSNSYIYGAGIGSTVIKLSSSANATQCIMTNSQNTRSVATNQGNQNITIKDLELDGNVSRFPGSYSPVGDTSGTGLCLSNVRNALIERISVHDTCRHCIDICAPETSITFNPLDYVPNPSFNVHLKDIIAYGAGDDNITTHFSHSITIENAYVPYTGGTEVPTNSNGIEIDDGSYDITIIGGYIKNCRRGLEVKGHSWAPAAKRIKVYGLTVENCVRNFGIRHLGFDSTDSKTAYDISLYNCTSIAPISSTFTTDTPRSLQISNYDGVFVKDFKVVGEHNASRAVTIQERARNVKIDGMTFTQISGAVTGITDALLYVDSTTRRNVSLQNIVFRDCVGLPIYITGSVPGIVVDGVDAFTTVSPGASSVVDFTWAPTTVPYTVRNVSVSGYNYVHTLGGSHNFDYTLPSNVGLIENIVPSSPASANTQYTVAKLGWREGTGQALNAGIGVRMDFTSNIFSGVSAGLDVPVAYIGTRKVNGTDSDVTSNLIFGTLSANNASMADRMLITPTGNVGINTAAPNERLTVRGSISATDTIHATSILSGGVDLKDIFLTTETDSQTLTWNPTSYNLSISNGNTVSLASLSSVIYMYRFDYVTNVSYSGKAVLGSLETNNVWTINRSIFTSAGALSATGKATNVAWTSRLSATYI